jgi:N-acetylglutamate synthase-like GNAT family acetyltransferase
MKDTDEMLEFRNPLPGQEFELAEVRARALKESLSAVGRYDETRVRRRLLDTYNNENTRAIYLNGLLVGFYAIERQESAYYLRHLYLDCPYQNSGIGHTVIKEIINSCRDYPIKLNALKLSKANAFYLKHGFTKTGEEEFDNLYEYSSKARNTLIH